VASFFAKKFRWTLEASVPQLVRTKWIHHGVNAIMREVGDARVWGGLHWRQAIRDGETLGRAVAEHVARNDFQRGHGAPGQGTCR
jgi:hypothetical protein